MALISTKNLVKTYQVGEIEVNALRNASFDIDPGRLIAFVGPSGSGKTTLLNLVGCLDKPTSGALHINGEDVTHFSRKEAAAFRGTHLGFVFQNFNLIPVLSVFENIEYPLVMVQNISSTERSKRIMELLEAVGMTNQKDKFPDQISGGQMQRVAIARALVTRPRIVLADEPTANLDHATAFMIVDLMKKMKDEFNTTFIFSTHDTRIIGEAEIIYTIEDGELTGQEVKSHG